MKFHHLGVPVTEEKANETYLDGAGVYVTDAAADPYNIEWLRFDDDSPMPKSIIEKVHVAFEVDNLDEAVSGKEVIVEPFSPMEGLKIAFILHDGSPIELMEMSN